MKKTIALFAMIGMILVNDVSAQLTTMQSIGSNGLNQGGGSFCNQDSLKFIENTMVDTSVFKVTKVQWIFHGAVDSIFEFTNLQQSIIWAKWPNSGEYRVEHIVTALKLGNSTEEKNFQNIGVRLNISKVSIKNANPVYLIPNDSIILEAKNASTSIFTWFKNSNQLQIGYDSLFQTGDTGVYIVKANVQGCISYDTVLVQYQTSTGLKQNNFSKTEVKLYPNPASDFIKIEGATGAIIEIYDLSGKLIMTSESSEINISNLKSGIYIIRDQNFWSEKLLIQ